MDAQGIKWARGTLIMAGFYILLLNYHPLNVPRLLTVRKVYFEDDHRSLYLSR